MLVGKLTGTGSLKGTLSGTGSLIGTLSGGGVGHGIPSGGEPGQGLIKVSDTDYDVKWMSILPEDTASGSVASFPDGSDDLPMGVVVDIDPVQDLNGYDNPWPAGGGKNKLPNNAVTSTIQGVTFTVNSDGTITANGNSTGWTGLSVGTVTLPAGSYRLIAGVGGSYNFNLYLSVTGAATASTANGESNSTFTLESEGQLTAKVFARPGQNIPNVTITPMIILASLTDYTYEPYSNISPISGWTGAKVTRTGVNVWDEEYVTNGYFEADGTWRNGNYLSSKNPIPVKPNTSYYFYEGIGAAFVTFWSKEVPSGASAAQYIISRVRAENRVITTPANCVAMHFNTTDYGTVYNNNISVNYPSTAHAYEPYTAVTHEIPFSTEVYGGTLNVETGELVVDRAYDVLPTSESLWSKSTSFPGGYYTGRNFPNGIAKSFTPFICSHAKTVTTTVYYVRGTCYCDNFLSFRLLGEDSTLQDWLNYIDSQANAGTPIQICYELATPITLTLTPVEIRSLLGDNNIFADTGDVSVTYKADIQKYIDKKISAAVAAMS